MTGQRRLPFEETPEHWKSQARIAGESGEIWCLKHLKCPFCEASLDDYEANYPVKDFKCNRCRNEFQLKTSKTFDPHSGTSITSSSFEKWYKAIQNDEQPNLLVMKYILREVCQIKEKIENPFEIDKNTVSLRGHRIFNKNGFVEAVYLAEREHIDEDCLDKRGKLSKTARRNGWKGSYLSIEGDKFEQIMPKEDANVCQV